MSQPAFAGGLHPGDPDLSLRQREVFSAVVELHGASAQPVGSETLAQLGRIALSSASIRSALADLESAGLLERSHPSAGRVPSVRGYEFFVRTLLVPAVLGPDLVAQVDETLTRSARDVERLLDQASRLLSTLTHQLGLALAASLERDVLTGLDLAASDERRVLMVLNLGPSAVRTLALELESPLERDELAEVAGVLRERLLGRMLSEVRERLASDPELVRKSAVRMVVRAAAEKWEEPVSTPLFSAGTMHIAEQPEFARGSRLGPLLRVVESGAPIDRLMVECIEGHVAVRVGLDEDQALAGMSLVSYVLPGPVRAAVGVLGPLRMNYAHALPVVDAVGSRVAELLST
ncbi:MAG TPA: heat-inducible transcriptional repressor HrcA [Candidatus Eisenbacteria bacterium]|jgi:heat-inducible transcriptional repressor